MKYLAIYIHHFFKLFSFPWKKDFLIKYKKKSNEFIVLYWIQNKMYFLDYFYRWWKIKIILIYIHSVDDIQTISDKSDINFTSPKIIIYTWKWRWSEKKLCCADNWFTSSSFSCLDDNLFWGKIFVSFPPILDI